MKHDNCVGCIHLWVDYERDWSDVTPGLGFMMECAKNQFHFNYDHPDVTDVDAHFHECITTARKCGLYELKPGY